MTAITSGLPKIKTQVDTSGKRYRLRDSQGRYLHLSAEGTTDNQDYAWFGTIEQARKIKAKAIARGDDWDFKAVKRGELKI